MARSREGNVLEPHRPQRSPASRSTPTLQPTVRSRDRAVVRMLDKIRKAIDRKPRRRDREARPRAGIETTDSRDRPRASTRRALHRQIQRAIVSTTADRTFVARTTQASSRRSRRPTSQQRFGTAIVVNRGAFQLTLYKKLKPAKTYSIAVGQVGLETPAGLYHIQNKAVNPAWNVPNSAWAGDARRHRSSPAARRTTRSRRAGWASSPAPASTARTRSARSARAASHGCIRMRIPDVIELYDEVPVGAPVYIA